MWKKFSCTGVLRLVSLVVSILMLGFATASATLGPQLGDGSLLRRTPSSPADTLEVVIFRVAFAQEEPDNSLTTGRGSFDSNRDTGKTAAKLDPEGKRGTKEYWEKQVAYAAQWYSQVSRGKLVVVPRVLPADSAWRLPTKMIDYRRTKRQDGEKLAQFDSAQTAMYLKFVRDAVRLADGSSNSPFAEALAPSRRHRAYWIVHAGSNSLLDGGSLGSKGANTPGDFVDFSLDPGDFKYLRDIPGAAADTLGIVLGRPGLDTLKRIAVLAETATQDGITWGIAGTLIHQIGRAIGLPVTYDAFNGISRLGSFDLMDFAGANAGNGFFPVMPSAWLRAYMGWEAVQEVSVGQNGVFALGAASLGPQSGDTLARILKIPLSSEEYLLLENRQRSRLPSAPAGVRTDLDSVKIPLDSVYVFFSDSLCVDSSCKTKKINDRQGKGVIQAGDHPDLGLPASGVAVWRVNESVLRRNLESGYLNSRFEGLLSDRAAGIQLVEADGLMSLGKTFRGSNGQKSYDFGHGAKLFPHLKCSSGKKLQDCALDTVAVLDAQRMSRGTWGGWNGLKLRFSWPDSVVREKSRHPFTGDSIVNLRAPRFDVHVEWVEKDSALPVKLLGRGEHLGGMGVASVLPVDSLGWLGLGKPHSNRDANSPMYLTARQKSGQAWAALLDSAYGVSLDYPGVKNPLADTSLAAEAWRTLPVLQALPQKGTFSGNLALEDSLLALQVGDSLWIMVLQKDSVGSLSSKVLGQFPALKVLPLVASSHVWWVDSLGLRQVALQDLGNINPQPKLFASKLQGSFHQLLWNPEDSALVLLGSRAQIGSVRGDSVSWRDPWASKRGGKIPGDLEQQYFQGALADFDRDGEVELAVVGSLGTVGFVDSKGWEAPVMRFARGQSGVSAPRGTLYADSTAVAVGDINGDAKPDLVFTGSGRLYALHHTGATLPGFPWQVQARDDPGAWRLGSFAPGHFGSAPLLADLDGDSQLEIALADGRGLLWAVDAKARTLAGFPLGLGSPQLDSNGTQASPWWQAWWVGAGSGLELGASGPVEWSRWSFPKARLGGNSWAMAGGRSGRWSWFDAGVLGDVQEPKAEIREFAIYPSPITGPKAGFLLDLGASVTQADVQVYSSTGLKVRSFALGALGAGRHQLQDQDFDRLGSDVYTARLMLKFASGEQKTSWFRFGIVR